MVYEVPKSGAVLDGRYVVDRVLGEGAHGLVIAASRIADGARVAVKLLDARAGDAHRLEREARVLARLEHPAIVRCHGTGRLPDGALYVELELVEGPTLGAVIAREGPLAPREAARLMLAVARALAAAHEAGVVHRDLHPGNVLVTGAAPERSAKVVDFGVAAFAEDAHLTPSGAAPGTVAYMAPEQLGGATTPQSDLYAWGLVFLECLAGRPAVTGRSFYEVAFKQLREDAVPLPAGLLDHPLGRLLERVLAKRLEARARSAAEVADALAAIDVTGIVIAPPGAASGARGPASPRGEPPPSSTLAPLGSGRERRHVTLLVVEPGGASADALAGWARAEVEPPGGRAAAQPDGTWLALFGLPSAREDDAAHAAHAALAVAGAGAGAARVGLASGVVVVDPRADAAAAATATRGTAVHATAVALARAAAPGEVVTDDGTATVLRARFACEPARGATAPMHRVVRPHAVPPRGAATPLVGRDRELAVLRRMWAEAQRGASGAAVVLGEAGIGKSRLLGALGEAVRADGGYWIDAACSQRAANTPLFPLLERARVEAGIEHGDDAVTARDKLVAHGLAAALGSAAEVDLVAELLVDHVGGSSGAARIRALYSLVGTRTGAPPTLITVEDAAWCDPTTLELLGKAVARPGARLLVVVSARAEVTLPDGLAGAAEIVLGRLDAAHAEALAREAARPATLAPDAMAQVVAAAEGVPLFVEELARLVTDPGAAAEPIPSTVRGLLSSRLDQLGPAQRTAQLAALVGDEVRHDVLVAVAPWGEDDLARDLDRMLRLGLVFQRGVGATASYRFAHHLTREVAHDSMLPDVRRAWHGALADALVLRFAALAEAEPERVARHFAQAGRRLEAASWAERAGRQAFARAAPVEALRHLRSALAEIEALPPSADRDALELAVQRGVAKAAAAVDGMATTAAESALRRVAALHHARGERTEAFVVERTLGAQQAMRARFGPALADAERAIGEAHASGSAAAEAAARVQRGMGLFAGARFVEADGELARAVGLLDGVHAHRGPSAGGADPAVLARYFRARALWHLGRPDAAVALAEVNVHAARALEDAHAEIVAQNGALLIHLYRRDPLAADAAVDLVAARAAPHPPPSLAAFLDLARVWVDAQRGQDRVDAALDVVDRFRASGLSIDVTLLCALLAEACVAVGRVEEGLAAVARGVALVGETGELHAEPELYRLRAALVDRARGAGSDDAREALEVAASLAAVAGSRGLSLRVACDLARWHLAHGDRADASAVLAPELAAAVEGDGTIDLLDARTLAAILVDR